MSTLRARARQLIGKESVLLEQARLARLDQERISKEIAELDRLLLRKDEMLATLEMLQVEAQGRKKADFEELLTSLIRDVIPDKTDSIVLTNGMRNNRASLDIDILVDGNTENVYEDKGGSISNIVAMGLRFIVLARNPNRRVLMFDEADCHLAREYIPAFASVLNSLANNMKIQVLYISHHPISSFEGYGRIIQLFKEDGKIYNRILGEEAIEQEGPDSAIRYLRLKNFGPHENTLVEFSSGLNIICGDMDLGKSKLIQAIADLTVNNGHERRIKHGKPGFEVELGLEEGMTLQWSYKREASKGEKKAKYVLKDKTGAEMETAESATEVPNWLHNYLAMPTVGGENIHLHSQKDSSYLLNSVKYTSIQRAQMLPLGRGSRDVLAMIQAFNTKLSNARSDRKRLEKELNKTQNLLATMSLILENPVSAEEQYAKCDAMVALEEDNARTEELINRIERLSTLNNIYNTSLIALDRIVMDEVKLVSDPDMLKSADLIERLSNEVTILKGIEKIPKSVPSPVLSDLAGLVASGSSINRLSSALKMLSKIDELAEISTPVLTADDAMNELTDRIEGLQNAASALQGIDNLPAIQKVELEDLSALENLISDLEALENKAAAGVESMKQCQAQIEQNKVDRAALEAELGGVCPTCDSPLKDHSHD